MTEPLVTAETVMRHIVVPRATAEKIATYANHRLRDLLPADARRATRIGPSTGHRYEKALGILCAREDLPEPRRAQRTFTFR